MRSKIILSVATLSALLLSGCMYTESALNYAKEGTLRVSKGYEAKAKMTKSLTNYLKVANEGCGVRVEIINKVPVTTVKECIRIDDAMASVDKVNIVQPQKVGDMLDSAGNFMLKATNLVVPVTSLLVGMENHKATTDANVMVTKSNNEAQTSMLNSYTGNFDKTSTSVTNDSVSVTDITDTSVSVSVSDTSVSDTSVSTDTDNTSVIPTDVTTDGTTTTIANR